MRRCRRPSIHFGYAVKAVSDFDKTKRMRLSGIGYRRGSCKPETDSSSRQSCLGGGGFVWMKALTVNLLLRAS